MYSPFTDNYVWNLSASLVLNTGGQIGEVAGAMSALVPPQSRGDEGTEAFLDATTALGDRLVELAKEDLRAIRYSPRSSIDDCSMNSSALQLPSGRDSRHSRNRFSASFIMRSMTLLTAAGPYRSVSSVRQPSKLSSSARSETPS